MFRFEVSETWWSGVHAMPGHVYMPIGVWLSVTPWSAAQQAPLSLEFSKQEYWIGLPFPTPGHLPNPWIKLVSLASLALAGKFFTTVSPWKPSQGSCLSKTENFSCCWGTLLLGYRSWKSVPTLDSDEIGKVTEKSFVDRFYPTRFDLNPRTCFPSVSLQLFCWLTSFWVQFSLWLHPYRAIIRPCSKSSNDQQLRTWKVCIDFRCTKILMSFHNLTEISPPVSLEPTHAIHKFKPTPQNFSVSFVSHHCTYLQTSTTFPTIPSILQAKYLHLLFFFLLRNKSLSWCYLADTRTGDEITGFHPFCNPKILHCTDLQPACCLQLTPYCALVWALSIQ